MMPVLLQLLVECLLIRDCGGLSVYRFYKLHTKGLCEVIPMTVPRKVHTLSVCLEY